MKLKIIFSTFAYLLSANVLANDFSKAEELQQIMVFDQTCIIMHEEGRKYLENKERISQSYGASALMEEDLESRIQEYSNITGDDINGVRTLVLEKGAFAFKELSKHQPRDLVSQCTDLVESIIRSKNL